jgi:hypothetical protein
MLDYNSVAVLTKSHVEDSLREVANDRLVKQAKSNKETGKKLVSSSKRPAQRRFLGLFAR